MKSPGDRPVAVTAVMSPWLADLLVDAGYAVMTATSGFAARELVVRSPPDVVVIDAVLDDMSGTEACRLLRTDPAVARQLPILILLDGQPSPELRVAALRVGAWDFLSPSAGREEVLLKVAAHVEAKRTVTEVVQEGLLDAVSGFCSRPSLARRARELAALMTRVRGEFTCLVVEVVGRGVHDLGGAVTHAARISDVVGDLGASRMGILAPGTDAAGAVRLAERVRDSILASAARSAPLPPEGVRAIRAGYDVVTNARYSPIEPFDMLQRAAAAAQHGEQDPRHPWIRRALAPDRSSAIDHASPMRTATATPPRHADPEVFL